MTVLVFISSLLAAMALGMPIAYSLRLTARSLPSALSMGQTTSRCWPYRFSCWRASS